MAEELRPKTSRVLKYSSSAKPNISKEKLKALKEFRCDESLVILTADKGVAMVVLNKQDYLNKAQNLLEQSNTYRTLSTDNTKKQKIKLINLLKVIKAQGA